MKTRITPHLEVESLSKHFTLHMLGGRQVHALEDVGFYVERGEFLGVLGRSGSGKSSLLRCVYRRYLPTRGSILYLSEDGEVDLARATDHTVLHLRKEEIGYVSQFLQAVPRTTALDVVAEPLIRQGVDPEEARELAIVQLDALAFPINLMEAYPSTMSGGERQRVNLARALLNQPRLLLLDEPTSALDPETRARAIEAIRELKKGGTTMIGIFHDTESMAALADRVLALEAGRVCWQGPANEAAELLTGV